MFNFLKGGKKPFPLCKNCRYCENPNIVDPECHHYKAIKETSPITGGYKFATCDEMRNGSFSFVLPLGTPGRCGKRGKLFLSKLT